MTTFLLSNSIREVVTLIFLDVKANKCFYRKDTQKTMIGGKPFDVESLLRDCVVKKKRPIHDALQLYDQQQQQQHQQQATDLSIGKEKIQSGLFLT